MAIRCLDGVPYCETCKAAAREPVEAPKIRVYMVHVEVTVESDEPYSDLELEKDVTDAIGELINVACVGRCDAIESAVSP